MGRDKSKESVSMVQMKEQNTRHTSAGEPTLHERDQGRL